MKDDLWEKVESDGTCCGCEFFSVAYDWVMNEGVELCGVPDDFPNCEHKIVFMRRDN